MESPLELYDNVMTKDDFERCEKLIHDGGWKFTGHSNDDSVLKFWFMDLTSDSFFTEVFFEHIQAFTKRKFKLENVYANGQTYGLDGDFHKDADHDNAYTFLYYVSDVNSDNVDQVGGYTQFKINDEVTCVEPLINRGVLFKSNIVHRGLAPSRLSGMLRVTIAFKLTELKESDVTLT